MSGLLKADFRRVFKDKLLIVMGILALVFAAITPLLYAVIFSGDSLAGGDEMAMDMLSGYISGKAQFFSSFSLGNNLGLIAPVLLAIVLCKDFSFGTIRNKIIAGKSRTDIYLSMFATCATVFIGVMLLHAFATLGISLLFFDYQAAPFTVWDFWYFVESLAFQILVLLCVAAMLACLCATMKNVGLVIVLFVAAVFGLVMVGSIIQVIITILEATNGSERAIDILQFIDRINIGNAATHIGMGTEYTFEDVLYNTLPSLAGIIGFTGLGLWKFNKKDLK